MKILKKCLTVILTGVMLISTAGCWDMLPGQKSFNPDPDSEKIKGAFLLFGEEISLPCTVADLTSQGFETDYQWDSDGMISMWPGTDLNKSGAPSHFYACIDREWISKLEKNEKVTEDCVIAAIKFQDDSNVTFELNDIEFGIPAEDFVNTFGKPAYEFDYGSQGYGRYYEGNNGCVYRFIFGYEKKLWNIMIATPEYINWEINNLYHG